jgi:hypothetical protein
LATELVTVGVIAAVADEHGWTINDTITRVSQLEVFDRLCDTETGLWTESPLNLAAMIDTEWRGDTIDPDDYFM